jgi:hypothetical protein
MVAGSGVAGASLFEHDVLAHSSAFGCSQPTPPWSTICSKHDLENRTNAAAYWKSNLGIAMRAQ